MCQPPHPPPPRTSRPLPESRRKTPAKGRHAPYSQQHSGATHARALLCLLVKLAGVAQVDRHWHPAGRRGKLRRRLGFRLCLSPRTTRPRGQQARRNGDRRKRKEESNQHTPTKYSPRSLVTQSARDTTDDNQCTAARRADKASTTKARGCGQQKKKSTPPATSENVRLREKGTQHAPRPAQLLRLRQEAPPRGRA